MSWKKLDQQNIQERVFASLKKNISYNNDKILGVPASYLDREVFYPAEFLKKAPYMSCLLENPNHIGCHTLDESEEFFAGTQELERDLLRICAEEFLEVANSDWDGYVATGGTEANIQAMWIYRNYYMEQGARAKEIGILHSEDTHYSVYKGSNLLNITSIPLMVDGKTRQIKRDDFVKKIEKAKSQGIVKFILILNMGTTMFGSVDDIDAIGDIIDSLGDDLKIHVDAAFGGFIYPITNPENALSFKDERISSFTMDAHKMLQAPYGTGIFIIKRPFMQYVRTDKASYVHGQDNTLVGSRSGANAVAVWMIMSSYGREGAQEFLGGIVKLTDYACKKLDNLNIEYFRNPYMNIITLPANAISRPVAEKFFLVPDNHDCPNWWKIVVMDHITKDVLDSFIDEMIAASDFPSP